MFKLLVVLAACLCIVYAASHNRLKHKRGRADSTDVCYVDELDLVLPVGHTAPVKPPSCGLWTCYKRDGTNETYAGAKGCGTFGVLPPCWIVDGEEGKPYPECCPTSRCP